MILDKFKTIETFIFDVDGVYTDGAMFVQENGDLLRVVNAKDGYATRTLVVNGYNVIIITGGNSQGVKKRFKNLGVEHVYLNVKDKIKVLRDHIKDHDLDLSKALYMGDDVPDYEIMQICGLKTCPKDACDEILETSDYISPKLGGKGAVRDVIEKVMKSRGDWHVTGPVEKST